MVPSTPSSPGKEQQREEFVDGIVLATGARPKVPPDFAAEFNINNSDSTTDVDRTTSTTSNTSTDDTDDDHDLRTGGRTTTTTVDATDDRTGTWSDCDRSRFPKTNLLPSSPLQYDEESWPICSKLVDTETAESILGNITNARTKNAVRATKTRRILINPVSMDEVVSLDATTRFIQNLEQDTKHLFCIIGASHSGICVLKHLVDAVERNGLAIPDKDVRLVMSGRSVMT